MSRIAIVIDNLVQFYSIKRGIDDLIKKDTAVDIYIAEDPGESPLAKHTYETISRLGYSVVSQGIKKVHYKVILEPYPKLEHKASLRGITYDYRLKFKYGLISTKPNPEHSPEWTIFYDAMLVHSSYEYELLNIYTETRLIKPMKYDGWGKKPLGKKDKKRLLYMPTFGDVRPEAYPQIESSFKRLKKKYKIIIKAHHATQFRESEAKHNELLHHIADEIYDSSTPIGEVLSGADVVLTGNSGSAFEAMYLNIPVSIYLDDLTKYDLGITSLQHKLIDEKVIPWTDDPGAIDSIVEQSFGKIDIQNQTADKLFLPKDIELEEFSSVVEEYIKRSARDDNQHQLRNQLRRYVDTFKKERAALRKDVNQLHEVINGYEHSSSWRITKPLRKAKQIIKRNRTL